jgi:hypothetical protein
MTTKLHAVMHAISRPLRFCRTAFHVRAAVLLERHASCTVAVVLQRYGADGFHEAPRHEGSKARTLFVGLGQPSQPRQSAIQMSQQIETKFGRLKDWRGVAIRYERHPRDSPRPSVRCNRLMLAGKSNEPGHQIADIPSWLEKAGDGEQGNSLKPLVEPAAYHHSKASI